MDGAKPKTPTAECSKSKRHIEDIGIDFLQPQEYYWDMVKRNPGNLKTHMLGKSKPSAVNVAKTLKDENVERADNSRKTCDAQREENVQLKFPAKSKHRRKKDVKARDETLSKEMLRKTAKILRDLPDGPSFSAETEDLKDCITKDEEGHGATPDRSSITELSSKSDSCPVVKKKSSGGDMYSSESVGSDSSSQDNDKIANATATSPSKNKKRRERFKKLRESNMLPDKRSRSNKGKQIKLAEGLDHLSDPEAKFKKFWICAEAVNDPKLRLVVFVRLVRVTQEFIESWCRPQNPKLHLEEESKNAVDNQSQIPSSSPDTCGVLAESPSALSSGNKPIVQERVICASPRIKARGFPQMTARQQFSSDSDTPVQNFAETPPPKVKRKRHKQSRSKTTSTVFTSSEVSALHLKEDSENAPNNQSQIPSSSADTCGVLAESPSALSSENKPIVQERVQICAFPRLKAMGIPRMTPSFMIKRKRHKKSRSKTTSTVFTSSEAVDEIIADVSRQFCQNYSHQSSDSEEETVFSPKKIQRISSATEIVPPRSPATEIGNSPISSAEISAPAAAISVISSSNDCVSADLELCDTSSPMQQSSHVKIPLEPEFPASHSMNRPILTFIRVPCSKDDLRRIGICAEVRIRLVRLILPFTGNSRYPNVFCHNVNQGSGKQSWADSSNRTVANRRKRRAKLALESSDDSESGSFATSTGKKSKHKRHTKLKHTANNSPSMQSGRQTDLTNFSVSTEAGRLADSQSSEVTSQKPRRRSFKRHRLATSRILVPTSSDSDSMSTSRSSKCIIPKPAELDVGQTGSGNTSKKPDGQISDTLGTTVEESVNSAKDKSKSEKNKSKSSKTDAISKDDSRKKHGTEKERSREHGSAKDVSNHKVSSDSNSISRKERESGKRSHRDQGSRRDDKRRDRHSRFQSASSRRDEDKLKTKSRSKSHSSQRRHEADRCHESVSRKNEKPSRSKGTKDKSRSGKSRGKSMDGNNSSWDLQEEYDLLCNIVTEPIDRPKSADLKTLEDDICEEYFLMNDSSTEFGSEEDENFEGKRSASMLLGTANVEDNPQPDNLEENVGETGKGNLHLETVEANPVQEPRDVNPEQELRDADFEQEHWDANPEQEPQDANPEQVNRIADSKQEHRDVNPEQDHHDVNAEKEHEQEPHGVNPEKEPQDENPEQEPQDTNPEQVALDENALSIKETPQKISSSSQSESQQVEKEVVAPRYQTSPAIPALSYEDSDSDVYDPLDSFESDHRMDCSEDVAGAKSPDASLSSTYTAPSPTGTAPSPTSSAPSPAYTAPSPAYTAPSPTSTAASSAFEFPSQAHTAVSPGLAMMNLDSPAYDIDRESPSKGSDSRSAAKFELPDFVVEQKSNSPCNMDAMSIVANKSQRGEDASDDAISLLAPSLTRDSIFGGEVFEENIPSKESVCFPAVHSSGHRQQPTAIVKPMRFGLSANTFDDNEDMFINQNSNHGSEKDFVQEFAGKSTSQLLEELVGEIENCNIKGAISLFNFVETKMAGTLKCKMLDFLLIKTGSGEVLPAHQLVEVVKIVNRVVPSISGDLISQVQLFRKCLKTLLLCKRTTPPQLFSQRLLDGNSFPGLTKLYNDILLAAINADASVVLHLYKEGKRVGIRLDFVVVRALFAMFHMSHLDDLAKDVYDLGCRIGAYLNITICEWPVCLKLRSYYTEGEISAIFTDFISKVAVEFDKTFFDDRQGLTEKEKYTIFICIENFQEIDGRNIRFLKDADPSLEAVHRRIRKVLHSNQVTKFTIAENFRLMEIDSSAVKHLLSRQKSKRLPLHLTINRPRWTNSSFYNTVLSERQPFTL